MEAAGKQLCVPAKSTKLEWTGRAVKELAGNGCVYVRLIKTESGDNSDSVTTCSSPELELVKIEMPGTLLSTCYSTIDATYV